MSDALARPEFSNPEQLGANPIKCEAVRAIT